MHTYEHTKYERTSYEHTTYEHKFEACAELGAELIMVLCTGAEPIGFCSPAQRLDETFGPVQ